MQLRHLPARSQTTLVARAQAIAVVAAAVTAVLYFLIGLGVLWVGRSTSSDTADLGAFGAIVGTVFAVAALLLSRFRSRVLWTAVAVLQVVVIVGYVAVSGARSPAFEAWGLLVKACQVVLLAVVSYLLSRDPRGSRPGVTRTVRSLAPLAVALLVFGVVVWQILDRDMAIGAWLLGAFLVGHGWVHLMFVMPRPAPASSSAGTMAFPFDLGHSWSTARFGLTSRLTREVGLVLMSVTVAGYTLAGLATVNVLIPPEWWATLVLAATAASVLLLGLFFQPGLLLGLGVDAVLLWLVISSAWRPGTG